MQLHLPTLGTLVLCLLLPVFPTLGTEEKTPIYDQAIELLADGKQPEAEQLVAVACATDPANPDLWFLRGVLERSRFSKYDAGLCLTIAWSLDPTRYRAEAAKAVLFMDRRREVNEGFQTLEKLIANHPDDLLLRWLFAIQCREHRRRAEEGAQQYATILKQWNPGPVLIHQTYANILSEQLGHHEEALVHRKIAVEQSYKAWTCQGYGNTLRKLGRFDEAIEWLEKAVKLAPGSPDYKRSLKNARTEKRRWEKASTPLAKALLFSGGYTKNLPKALELYKKAAEDGDTKVYIQMGIIYRNGGEGFPANQAKAAECFEKAYEAGIWHGATLLGIMYEFGRAGPANEELALKWFKLGAEKKQLKSLSALVYYYAANRDPAKCDAQKARKYLEELKAVHPHPESNTLRSFEAMILAQNGEFEKAAAIEQSIIDIYCEKYGDNLQSRYVDHAQKRLECYRAKKTWKETLYWVPVETQHSPPKKHE